MGHRLHTTGTNCKLPNEAHRNVPATVEALDRLLSLQVAATSVDARNTRDPRPALALVCLQAPLDDVQHADEAAEHQYPGEKHIAC